MTPKERNILSFLFKHYPCSMCGECCRRSPPVFGKKEIKKYAEMAGMSSKKFRRVYCHYDKVQKKYGMNSPCAFYNEETTLCGIHDDKPLVCQLFPFEVFEDKSFIVVKLTSFCGVAKAFVRDFQAFREQCQNDVIFSPHMDKMGVLQGANDVKAYFITIRAILLFMVYKEPQKGFDITLKC